MIFAGDLKDSRESILKFVHFVSDLLRDLLCDQYYFQR